MDNLEYLNSITPSSRPAPSRSFRFPIKKLLMSLGAIFLAFLAFFIIKSALTPDDSVAISDLNSRSSILAEVTSAYQPSLHSTSLRAASASARTVLTSISSSLTDYSGKNPEKYDSSSLTTTLEHAKLNGYLDRTFAREFSYELSLLITDLTSLAEKTTDRDLSEFLSSSADSLLVVLPSFENYSEATFR